MKNKLVLIAALFIAYFTAQPAKAQLYDTGDITVNAGLSLGVIGYGGYGFYSGNFSGFFPLTANVEYSINDQFAVGGYAAFYSRGYKYGNGYKDGFRAFAFGGRGTFHATPLLNDALDLNLDENKLDLYASVIAGLQISSWYYDNDYWNQPGFNMPNNNRVRPVLGPVLGVRYMFNPGFGVYFEGGRGALGWATFGASFKF
ncbi:hypothetical protein GXP67_08155 [Rhodocytophaga rosea]|uniref:Outer membrane beta-barrel protein n=1 Tax=Rhodocytophaga rosea TaxID=2704465 RepID=A0A6C0GF28_9BACT|nr:hypothetical protein [Rhodocytophaga rosea]QHT66629.1 hypothetical protein GXP67_08155 [Rhodocytophaga rosea]